MHSIVLLLLFVHILSHYYMSCLSLLRSIVFCLLAFFSQCVTLIRAPRGRMMFFLNCFLAFFCELVRHAIEASKATLRFPILHTDQGFLDITEPKPQGLALNQPSRVCVGEFGLQPWVWKRIRIIPTVVCDHFPFHRLITLECDQ